MKRYILQACIKSAAIGNAWVDLGGDDCLDTLKLVLDRVRRQRPLTPLRIVNVEVDSDEPV